jgi:hypothetical protein
MHSQSTLAQYPDNANHLFVPTTVNIFMNQ